MFRRMWTTFQDKALEDYLYELNRRIAAGFASAGAQWANFVFVGKDGDDATAVRGDLSNKFLTVQAALNAAQPGDVVFVGPGIYEENVTWPDTDSVTVSGQGNAIVKGADGVDAPVIGFASTHNLQGPVIVDMAIEKADVTAAAVAFNGSAVPNFTALTERPLVMWRTSVISGGRGVDLELTVVGDALVRDCIITGETVTNQCGVLTMSQCRIGPYTGNYDATLDHPPAFYVGLCRAEQTYVNGRAELTEHAQFQGFGCYITEVFAQELHVTPDPEYRRGGFYLEHCSWDDLDVGASWDQFITDHYCVEGYNCHAAYGGTTQVRNYQVGEYPGAAGRFRNTDFYTLISDGGYIDASQCFLRQSRTSGPNGGRIDRDVWAYPNQAIAASPGASFGWPIAYGSGQVYVLGTSRTALGNVECRLGAGWTAANALGGQVAGAPGAINADLVVLQIKTT